MKNLKYYPYERNRYFFGKLMTVSDFDAEQRYMNDKRRLQNRLLHGAGVVCGLNVLQVDDTVISLEPGMALDALGREIVVEAPVIKKLSMIPGFDSAPDNATLYLCIEYDEEEREPVYSVADQGTKGEGINHNKIGESYKLTLTDQEPDLRSASMLSLVTQSISLVEHTGVRITLQAPRFVEPGELFDVSVRIQKLRKTQPISLSMGLHFSCASASDGQYDLMVEFDETQHLPKEEYVLRYSMRAARMKDAQVSLRVMPEHFSCRLGDRSMPLGVQGEVLIDLCKQDLPSQIIEEYTQMGLDDIASASTLLPIVLARIQVVGAVHAYSIDHVKPLPFGQLIITAPLATALDQAEKDEISRIRRRLTALDEGGVHKGEEQTGGSDLGDAKCGVTTITVPLGAKSGDVLHSEELVHGLGLGYVSMQVGLCQEGTAYQPVAFGDGALFGAGQGFTAPAAQAGALTYPDKGTFRIGIKLNRNASEPYSVTVRWWAFRDASMRNLNVRGKSLTLRPDMAYVSVRESITFEVVTQGLTSSDCVFSVKEAEGGIVDAGGKYTAPGQPGVYEVTAKSLADNSVTASAFVVVRERD